MQLDEDRRIRLQFPDYGKLEHTPASVNGCIIFSFHQNCLVTLRHKGSVGFGSAKRSTPSSLISSDADDAAFRDSVAVFLFNLANSCCLCCSDVVISYDFIIYKTIVTMDRKIRTYQNCMQSTFHLL